MDLSTHHFLLYIVLVWTMETGLTVLTAQCRTYLALFLSIQTELTEVQGLNHMGLKGLGLNSHLD